jgi:hypothetical protein
MMEAMDGDAHVSSRLTMLQDMRRPRVENAEILVPALAEASGIASGSATETGSAVRSDARCLVEHEAPLAALRDAGWILVDALEFSTVYAVC